MGFLTGGKQGGASVWSRGERGRRRGVRYVLYFYRVFFFFLKCGDEEGGREM